LRTTFNAGRTFQRVGTWHESHRTGGLVIAALLGVAVGIKLAYFFDPERGAERREAVFGCGDGCGCGHDNSEQDETATNGHIVNGKAPDGSPLGQPAADEGR
jgi:hypothetical protein